MLKFSLTRTSYIKISFVFNTGVLEYLKNIPEF